MNDWSLSKLLSNLHQDIERKLAIARESFVHPSTKGDASEGIWIELFQKYLPKRYRVEKGHIVDSNGKFSNQIDIVIFDRQYTPLIFDFQGQLIIPAESVYGVFEAKQTINASLVAYAKDKLASVRTLHRTSLPIPHAGGTYEPKKPLPILGGILTFDSDWSPPLGKSLSEALKPIDHNERLDFGCIAAHGFFTCDDAGCYTFNTGEKSATAFLLELIARLQNVATVPMIDIRAYAQWLVEDK
ncbi:DUF6602 domain-containing protein [Herpetosiphon geysericola]|uniref:DUF6602 domain-containing protein n=1 Tax=Herpetosiphon geysericola TaxID=70996 RepID=A0A0P6YLF5_9CHLR|nr:DUF6602 domain-containing protein [Herpetosiphon geysericola]KPL91456.1 hypothetical protein SE18_02055 [Herpetosiphon geysericola]